MKALKYAFITGYLLLITFLSGCHSIADSHHTHSPAADTIPALEKLKKAAKLFDNHLPFEILSFTNSLNNNTTDSGTLKCGSWNLSKTAIEKIIKNAEPISGTAWDIDFLVLTCEKSVSIAQGSQNFTIDINAGSFFSVNNGDTAELFGNYNKEDRKYFMVGPASDE